MAMMVLFEIHNTYHCYNSCITKKSHFHHNGNIICNVIINMTMNIIIICTI